jgi:lipid A 4'-phosphatase
MEGLALALRQMPARLGQYQPQLRLVSRNWGLSATLLAIWCLLLAVFHFFPSIDLQTAQHFFTRTACAPGTAASVICGHFPDADDTLLIIIRKCLFYLPAFVGIAIVGRLLQNLGHHGATYCRETTRQCSIALIALIAGPYVLVNVILKQISHRPRPYQTDLLGGAHPFTSAGDFTGACVSNCSFISGEASGSGWLVCLIVLLPKQLRLILAPPIIVLSLISPALRVGFGGHYVSDVVLGWLSSLVVYAVIAECFEMSQSLRKRSSPTAL